MSKTTNKPRSAPGSAGRGEAVDGQRQRQNELATERGDVLTAKEAAELLRITIRTLRDHCTAGRIPHRRVGGQFRFSRSTLLDWIAGKGEANNPSR